MDFVVEPDPEEALLRAERSGVLVIPYEANFAEDEWWPTIEQWDAACRAAGHASVSLLIDRESGRARIHFDGKGVRCFAEQRLDGAMGRVLEDVVDGNGFAEGPFASWRTVLLPLRRAGRVAAKARRLDRLARDPVEAAAFEDGGMLAMVRSVHAL